MAIRSSVEYWTKKAAEHRTQSAKFLKVFLGLGILVAAGLFFASQQIFTSDKFSFGEVARFSVLALLGVCSLPLFLLAFVPNGFAGIAVVVWDFVGAVFAGELP